MWTAFSTCREATSSRYGTTSPALESAESTFATKGPRSHCLRTRRAHRRTRRRDGYRGTGRDQHRHSYRERLARSRTGPTDRRLYGAPAGQRGSAPGHSSCRPPRALGSNGTEKDVKVFSFVDSAECPGVKRAGGRPQRGLASKGATRAATDRPTPDRNPSALATLRPNGFGPSSPPTKPGCRSAKSRARPG